VPVERLGQLFGHRRVDHHPVLEQRRTSDLRRLSGAEGRLRAPAAHRDRRRGPDGRIGHRAEAENVMARRRRGEDGTSLLLVLAFLALAAALVPALLRLGSTNLLATSRLHGQRAAVYAADGATDAALQYLRQYPQCGRLVQIQPPST